jgi:hypothetical protein
MVKFCLTCCRVALRSWKNWPHRTPIPFLPEVGSVRCPDCGGSALVPSEDIAWVNVHGEGNTGLPDYWELEYKPDGSLRRWGRPYLALIECRCGQDAVVSEFVHASPEYAVNCPMCGVTRKSRLKNEVY